MYPQVLAVWDWEIRWSAEDQIPPVVTHALCGKAMRPIFQCRECKLPVRMWEVSYKPGSGSRTLETVPSRFQRRSKGKKVSGEEVDRHLFHFIDVVGDRWTGLVVAALFFGLKRYDEIGEALGIATNILSDRLKTLVSAGVLKRIPYQERPVRHEYRLTEKGADLYIHALQVHEWAERWLLEQDDRPLLLEHKPCRSPLTSEAVCSECGERLEVWEVSYCFDNTTGGG